MSRSGIRSPSWKRWPSGFPSEGVWPADRGRARLRALGLSGDALGLPRSARSKMPMNIRASHPGKGMTPEVRADIDRIERLWREARSRFGSGGDFLFGRFSAADAMFAPVVMRFATYGVACGSVAARYCEAVKAAPGVRALGRGRASTRRNSWPRGRTLRGAAAALRRGRRVAPMKIYAVGGSVRDELLGRPVTDRDWVVVGATPAEMAARGFRAVGIRFPGVPAPRDARGVRARPHRAQDRAGLQGLRLPRLSRGDSRGGPAPARPHHQCHRARRGRHAGRSPRRGGRPSARHPAARERGVRGGSGPDPARCPVRRAIRLRGGARRRWTSCERMVRSGEADHLVPERVWQEIARGLQEPRPARMIDVLRECGALARVLPEVDALAAGDGAALLAARLEASTAVPASRALRLPYPRPRAGGGRGALRADQRPRGMPRSRRPRRPRARGGRGRRLLGAEALLALLERTDAFRRPERLERLMEVCECDLRARALSRRVPRDRTSRRARRRPGGRRGRGRARASSSRARRHPRGPRRPDRGVLSGI